MMDGVLVINKPAGVTSSTVVQKIKRRLGARKAGHSGTLDPLATGVLPVCINEATKLSRYLSAEIKEYLATALLGVETDTYDIEGKVLSRSEVRVTEAQVLKEVGLFAGKQLQAPPPFSAVKHQGKPLYKSARKGIFIEKPAREIEVFKIEVEKVELPRVTFFISCSKGTYVRSICAELGQRLGTKGCLAELHRTRSGFFSEDCALDMDAFERDCCEGAIRDRIISLNDALPGMKAITAGRDLEIKLRDGHQPQAGDLASHNIPSLAAGDMIKIISSEKKDLLAVGEFLHSTETLGSLENMTQVIKIARVFCVGQPKPSNN
ncbi:MAG: tRNA pseudouridine(55) synthase TruB [Syntrophaceae bacterium]